MKQHNTLLNARIGSDNAAAFNKLVEFAKKIIKLSRSNFLSHLNTPKLTKIFGSTRASHQRHRLTSKETIWKELMAPEGGCM